MKSFETRIKKKLSEREMTIQRLASESGISEPTLHAIFNRGDAKVSQLEKISGVLDVTLGYLLGVDETPNQTGIVNQSHGSHNTQRVKLGGKGTAAPDGSLNLTTCLVERDSYKQQLALANALIASQAENITLLKGSHNQTI